MKALFSLLVSSPDRGGTYLPCVPTTPGMFSVSNLPQFIMIKCVFGFLSHYTVNSLEAEAVLFQYPLFSGITSVSPIAAIHETWPPGRNIPQQPHHLALHSLSDLILGRKYLKYRPEDLQMLLLGISDRVGYDQILMLHILFQMQMQILSQESEAESFLWLFRKDVCTKLFMRVYKIHLFVWAFQQPWDIVYIPKGLDSEQPRIEHKGNILPCYFVLQWEA